MRRTSPRPQVESLEARDLPTITPLTYHSKTHAEAAVVAHVKVFNVFWGAGYSTSPSLKAAALDLNRFMKYLVTSPFMDALKQYHIGHGTFQGSRVLTKVPTKGTVTGAQIQAAINAMVKLKRLPPPSLSQLYMVYLPPGVTVGAPGYHSDPWTSTYDPNAPGGWKYHDFNFAAIESDTTVQRNTVVASHELAEAVTDPRVGSGWYNDDGFAHGNGGEVADLAAPNTYKLHGYAVTQLYSNAAGGLVSPGA